MGKKDAILITVMMNVVLLILLFAFSEKRNEEVKPPAPVRPTQQRNEWTGRVKGRFDEVDQLLMKYEEVEKLAEEKSATLPAPTEEPVSRSLPHSTPPADLVHPTEIIVKAGDTLDKISRVYKVSIQELKRINHLSDHRLQIGQTLRLSDQTQLKREVFYTVKSGDNPWTIAMKNQIKLDDLLRLNHLDEEKAKKLKPGDQLRIQ